MNLTTHWKAHKLDQLEKIKQLVKKTSTCSDRLELLSLYNRIRDDLNFADREVEKGYGN